MFRLFNQTVRKFRFGENFFVREGGDLEIGSNNQELYKYPKVQVGKVKAKLHQEYGSGILININNSKNVTKEGVEQLGAFNIYGINPVFH